MNETTGTDVGELEDLLAFIRDSRGFDFTGYKRSTLGRRIHKRMSDVGLDNYADYRDHLEADAEEFRLLFNTILINVTGFFRDPDTWHYLQDEILPALLAGIGPDDEIRVWSAGCSSGEEAYSLAMVFAEALGIDECVQRVKIYGTDVDEEALREARAGLYNAKDLQDLPQELAERYFEPSGQKLAFRADLRRRVIFGRHDITRDAPISRLDLLVCRNTLMYFNAETQTQIVDRFHFALRDSGYLFLGMAEMLLAANDQFEVASMRQRIFRRREGEMSPMHPFVPSAFSGSRKAMARYTSRRRRIRDLILEAGLNATIGLDTDGTIVLLNTLARTQFGLSTQDIGRPLRDLEISYRPIELRSLIDQALAERRPLRVNSVEHRHGSDELQYLDVLVQPLWEADGMAAGVAIVFDDSTLSTRLQREVKRIREELETAYQALQSTNEELETTNEELQSSIEELETTNEELQSTNEELETTNEELQSGNEELESINEQIRVRTSELDEARAFLEGVLSSVAAGVVVLDSDLRVRSWNRGAEEMWGLRASEVQRQLFFGLDIGLPTEQLVVIVDQAMDPDSRRRGQLEIDAINRRGQAIRCSVVCTPLNSTAEGAVLLMEEKPLHQ